MYRYRYVDLHVPVHRTVVVETCAACAHGYLSLAKDFLTRPPDQRALLLRWAKQHRFPTRSSSRSAPQRKYRVAAADRRIQ